MAPTILVLGATGYIGGHVTKLLIEAHPEYHIIALVRNEDQAQKLKETWPDVETVLGDLDSHDILVEQAKRADVVLQLASADHNGVITSTLSGLALGAKNGKYIHTSGTGVLINLAHPLGTLDPKIYDDVASIAELVSLDAAGPHVAQDHLVRSTAAKLGIEGQIAMVCPPTIYGVGEGPVKRRSVQIPLLIEAVIKRGKGFTVNGGENEWDFTHISDLARAYILLTELAVSPAPSPPSPIFGPHAYYFVESSSHTWAAITAAVAHALSSRGVIRSAALDTLTPEQAAALHPLAPSLGTNARSRASRLRALGWQPRAPGVFETLGKMVGFEIARLEAEKEKEKEKAAPAAARE